MTIHTVPSRDFARDVGHAKRLAAEGPVLITDRGRPAYALLKIDDFYKLGGRKERSLLDLMDALPDTSGIELDAPRIDSSLQIPELG